MPKVNYTIDNVVPTILYTPRGNWVEGNVSLDSRLHEYHDQTYTTTLSSNSTVTFNFNGTGVWVYGAKNPNHGNYSVHMDGTHVGDFVGSGDYNIQAVLYSAVSLAKGMHTVALSYTPIEDGRYFDIDFITYEVDIGTPNETLELTTVQDTDPKFTYSPAAAWSSVMSDTSDKFKGLNGTAQCVYTHNSTNHTSSSVSSVTSQNDATASFEFLGDAISIWGSIGPNNSPYSVSLDGGTPIKYNATNINYFSQVMLFEANNLGPCKHTVLLKNEPESLGEFLSIDYAIVTNTASTKGSGSCQPRKIGLSGGIAAGIVIGGIVVVIIIFLAMWFVIWRRRRSRQDVFTPVTTPRPFGESSVTLVSPSTTMFTTTTQVGRQSYTSRPASSSARATMGSSSPEKGKRQVSYNPAYQNQSRVDIMPRVSEQRNSIQHYQELLGGPEREIDVGPLPPSYNQATQP